MSRTDSGTGLVRLAARFGVVVACVAALGYPAVAASADTTTGPKQIFCNYQVNTSWSGGFVASLAVTNYSPNTINGWTIRWTFHEPTTVGVVWAASLTQPTEHDAVALNTTWNGVIPNGQTMAFGWSASA